MTEKIMKKKSAFILILFLTYFSFSEGLFNYNSKISFIIEDETFELKPALDIPLATAATLTVISSAAAELGEKNGLWNLKNNDYDASEINKSDIAILDQIFMTSYKKGISLFSTLTAGMTVAAPALLLPLTNAKQNGFSFKEILVDGAMYYETMAFAWGIKEWIKLLVNRPRPYMYYENFPENKLQNGDWNDSFLSGHTTLSFAAATFLSYTYFQYYPEEKSRFWVMGASYALAATTAVLRIASGSHFSTDVIAGALLGTFCGIAVPYMHTQLFYSKFKKKNSNDSVDFYGSPTSAVITVRF